MSIEFDPRNPEFRANPYPFYDALRENAPIFHWTHWDTWFLTRYEDCHALLRDNRLGHGQFGDPPDTQQDLHQLQSNWLLFKNPPDHTRLRSLVHKAFTPRRVAHMQADIQIITDDLLNKIMAQGHMDVMADLAAPLPVAVIARMFGVPEEDYDKFYAWSNPLARSLDLVEDTQVYDEASQAAASLKDYIKYLADKRRREPGDDLLSALVAVEEAGEKLSEIELYATCSLLLVAGHETTINLIGNGTLALFQNPGELQKLRDSPDLIKPAIEELLRYDSPVQLTSRMVLEEFSLGEHTFPAGKELHFMLGAANRDPARFENPNQLNLSRERNQHLAFGGGIHYCLGAPLARLEGQIAIGTLVQRLPQLKLEIEAPQYRDNYLLRGLETLPISF